VSRSFKWTLAGVALLLCAGLAWYFGSPYLTLSRMARAADRGDAAAFIEYVDVDALRADVVADLKRHAERQLEKLGDTPYEVLGRRFMAGIGTAFAARVADPKCLMERFARERRSELVVGSQTLSEFWLVDQQTGERRFMFRRRGLGWKLSAVALEDVRL